MNGTEFAVHQSSSRIDRRKLVSMTRSPSVAVVSEIAPRWMIASSFRPASHCISSAGGTTSASCPLGEIAPFPVAPKKIAYGHVRPARIVKGGDDVRSDKTGSAGHQQH